MTLMCTAQLYTTLSTWAGHLSITIIYHEMTDNLITTFAEGHPMERRTPKCNQMNSLLVKTMLMQTNGRTEIGSAYQIYIIHEQKLCSIKFM